jgi:transposase
MSELERIFVTMTKQEQQNRRAVAAHMWEKGLSGPEIARELGMSEMGLYQMIKRMRQEGWQLTNRKPKLSARFARIRQLEQRSRESVGEQLAL